MADDAPTTDSSAAPAVPDAPGAANAPAAAVPSSAVPKATRSLPPRRIAVPSAGFQLSGRATVALIIAAVVIAVTLAYLVVQMTAPIVEAGPPKLAAEVEAQNINFAMRPPVNWAVEDRHDGFNLYIKGPREPGFSPVIVVSLEIKPGGIETYLREHKGRIAVEDPSVKWLSEEADSLDGCPHTVRLEYECKTTLDDGTAVSVRALQYIMEDKPRFYRVTCFASAETFEKYLPRFEASARTFKRTPLPKAMPQPIQ
jgi:hypothetical protein